MPRSSWQAASIRRWVGEVALGRDVEVLFENGVEVASRKVKVVAEVFNVAGRPVEILLQVIGGQFKLIMGLSARLGGRARKLGDQLVKHLVG